MSKSSSKERGRQAFRRVGLIAAHAVSGAIRLRLAGFAILVGALVICGSWFLRDLSLGRSEMRLFFDAGSASIQGFGSILAVVVMVQTIFLELEDGTAGVLLSGKLCRWEWISGKLIGAIVVLLAFITIIVALWAVALFAWDWKGDYGAADASARFGLLVQFTVFGFMQWMQLSLLCAIALFVCTISESAIYALCVSFLSLVVCHLGFVADLYGSQASSTPLRITAWLVGCAVPDFQLYTAAARFAADEPTLGSGLVGLAGYTLVYVAVFSALAIFAFLRREV